MNPPLSTSNPPSGRRLRDRLVARDTDQARHTGRADIANLMLLIDDDLHETAASMNEIERFLSEALQLLDGEELRAHELLRLCADDGVLERMDSLAEALATLRRRFGALATMVP